MRPMRFLTLAICAATVMAAPVVAAGDSAASSRHVGKHHARTSPRVNNALASEQSRTFSPARNFSGDVCPGNARSFDCKIWPPPVQDDPDRKGTGGDGM